MFDPISASCVGSAFVAMLGALLLGFLGGFLLGRAFGHKEYHDHVAKIFDELCLKATDDGVADSKTGRS